MPEEKLDWKEKSIAEYAKLEKEKAKITQDMNSDPRLSDLEQNFENLKTEIEELKASYTEEITRLEEEQKFIKARFAEKWDINDKTYKCNHGIATIRTIKSLQIRSAEKLIEYLAMIKKLPEYVKSFDITKLRKIKEAGLLDDEIAIWDEKQSISIKLNDEEEKE
jgi:predicted RNase H-like nuclease (RuvC/YqgF family)